MCLTMAPSGDSDSDDMGTDLMRRKRKNEDRIQGQVYSPFFQPFTEGAVAGVEPTQRQ